jgi:heme/copper-type cytochrome/quinol oxidase subunit 2
MENSIVLEGGLLQRFIVVLRIVIIVIIIIVVTAAVTAVVAIRRRRRQQQQTVIVKEEDIMPTPNKTFLVFHLIGPSHQNIHQQVTRLWLVGCQDGGMEV